MVDLGYYEGSLHVCISEDDEISSTSTVFFATSSEFDSRIEVANQLAYVVRYLGTWVILVYAGISRAGLPDS